MEDRNIMGRLERDYDTKYDDLDEGVDRYNVLYASIRTKCPIFHRWS